MERIRNLPYSLRVYGVTEAMFEELVDEDTRAELMDGVMIVHSPASLRRDYLGGFLRGLMADYAEESDQGVVLGPDSLVHLASCRRLAPAVFFLRQKRVRMPLPDQFEGAPDLVVEVLSPSNRAEDLQDKRPAYREAGVPEIWFVDPDEHQVLIDRRRKKTYSARAVSRGRVASAVLKGFWIEASWLWSEPLPRRKDCLRAILGGK
jgi:Uma2 family endonuclease